MSVSTSAMSYQDCYTALDAALADPMGVRIKLDHEAAAIHFRMRCHQARKINREDNCKIYENDHPLWGRSEYDLLTLRIRHDADDNTYLYIEKNDTVPGEIELLSGLEPAQLEHVKTVTIEHKPQLVIEHQPSEPLKRRM